jgi:hypothetical protein
LFLRRLTKEKNLFCHAWCIINSTYGGVLDMDWCLNIKLCFTHPWMNTVLVHLLYVSRCQGR